MPLLYGVQFAIGGVVFGPLSITNCELWLDASNAGSITKDGSNLVSQIDDLSGNGRNFSQATGTKQPTYTASAINGRSALLFDGTDDKLSGNTGSNRSTFTIAMVLKSSRQRRFDTPYDSSDGTTGDITFETGAGNNTMEAYVTSVGAAGTTSGTWSTSTTFSTFLTYNGTTMTGYINNAGSGSGSTSSRTLKAACSIGGDNGTTGFFYWKDYIAEVVLYSKVLDSTERSNLQAYFAAKWGI